MTASGLQKGIKTRWPGTNWDLPKPFKARSFVSAWLVLTCAAAGLAQEEKAAKPEKDPPREDFAEVYTDRYFEPYEQFKLGAAAQNRSRVLALYAMGRTFEERKDMDRAIDAYREVLELVPSYTKLAQKVANLLAENGRAAEGRKILEESLARNPSSPYPYLVLSKFLATFLHQSPEIRKRVVELAEEASAKFPGNPDVIDHIVKTYKIAREPEKAQAVMDAALKREDTNPFYWLRVAETAKLVWPVSNKVGAEPVRINGIYEKALKCAPNHPMIQEKVADHYRDSRQSEKARELYEKLIERFPDRLDLRKELAGVFAALGKNDERIETLEAVVRINPQDAETHKELGRIYQAREDRENAIVHYREGLRIAQGSVTEYYDLGWLMLEAEQGEEAVRLLERGAYLFPTEPLMTILLTHAYSMLDEWEKAAKLFERTAELASQTHPDMLNDRFYFRYGAAVERSGDLERAANLFRKSMALLSKNLTGRDETEQTKFRATLYNYLGYMWVEHDMNIDEGGALIRQAHDLDPGSGAIIDSLGWFYFKKGKFEDAKRELLKAVGMIEKPDAVIHDHLARAYFELGDFGEALSQMKLAVDLDPENEEFQERLTEFEKKKPKADPEDKKPVEPEPEPEPESGDSKEAPGKDAG